MILNKHLKAGIIFFLVICMFSLTAFIEYNSVLNENRRSVSDDLLIIQTQLYNILDSRINSANNTRTFIELNPDFDQSDFDHYIKTIFETSNNVIRNITFIKDTTISHVYPYMFNRESIGTDLAKEEDQIEMLLYAKENQKVVVTGPVDLVEGGKGIIVRIPFIFDDAYYGQIALVFDYELILIESGINDLIEEYNMVLSTFNPINDTTSIIWSNANYNKNMISHEFDIYDFTLRLDGSPKSGWNGFSLLLIIVILLGLILSISAYIIVINLLREKEKLRDSHEALEESNGSLESSNNQLVASKQNLLERYDELEIQKGQIQYLAHRDPLTGLYNRRKCIDDFEYHLSNNKKMSIILFDLDNFKNINDTRGHVYGDKILTMVANWLEETLPEHATPYRIGGDEFVIFMPIMFELSEIKDFMQHLFKAFQSFKINSNVKEPITLSAGIASSPDHGSKVATLMMKADLAMYASKNAGKNQYAFFDDVMYNNLNQKLHIEDLLRSAVANKDFYLVYQPIITSSYEVHGFEALIRMNETQMSPAVFIPIAEELGLIGIIGKWVITNVLIQMKAWQDTGITIKPVAINMSPSQIYEGGIDVFIDQQTKHYGIDPKLIEIEVTENIFISNNKDNVETLEKIKALGCAISLDDFGSGFSSLSYLTYMPVKKIKLDKGLKDKFLPIEDIKLMEGLIAFCHSLKLQVVTEGVETFEEAVKLVDQGSDLLQGYVFSKPVLPEEALKLMHHQYKITE